ncbi:MULTISPECIES: helix-turn-helix domain-containing protein [unclassified Nocardioides]|uniref:winged helix-turn-helix transcriptional regulator n=1 Tax=unclassified Nocardioides TaxID=2615069 RepID=UPI00266711EB|nr:helix-turn-helix domain-containing protein [Nocardioides sp. Arc9.136]WKN48247.1 helix-turn-helix domain-containing protein [Nocardioides sp. Arc9.136]
MSRYGQYCPITRSLEILGDRWTLLIVRDLLLGANRFNELARGLPTMSRAILSKRLDLLERHGLLVHDGEEYRPTPACQELHPIIFGLAEWGARWAFGEPRSDELDPTVLMWWIRGGIDAAPFGGRRVVLHVRLSDGRRRRFWFVISPHDVSLCFTDPGHEVDVWVDSSLSTLYQVWEGRIELRSAVRDGLVGLSGRREVLLVLPDALLFSPVAPLVRRTALRPAAT